MVRPRTAIATLGSHLRSTLGAVRSFPENARAIVVMEPLWGIPYNLYSAYASIYMLELGCTSVQVGLVASISLACNMLFSLPSGHLTDRFGRRRTTLVFDILSWSVATLIWAFAGGVVAFVVAAAVNALVRIVSTAWSCLLVEGTDPTVRVHVYAWVSVAGILAGFVSPVAGLLVGRFGVIRSMRGLYLFAFASMTSMFFIRNAMMRETDTGRSRMLAVRHFSLADTVADFRRVAREILRNPAVLAAFALAILLNVQNTLRGSFVSILLTRGLDIPVRHVALFPAISSAVMLAVYVFGLPALSRGDPVRPLLGGFALLGLSAALLAAAPKGGYALVVASTVTGAMGGGVAVPFTDALLANSVPDEDRATSLAIVYTLLFGFSAPFGYVGGLLASLSPRLPLALTALLALACLALAFRMRRAGRRARPGPAA
jgi:MFS transporter, DHA1 family, tetracycline resistance protein